MNIADICTREIGTVLVTSGTADGLQVVGLLYALA